MRPDGFMRSERVRVARCLFDKCELKRGPAMSMMIR